MKSFFNEYSFIKPTQVRVELRNVCPGHGWYPAVLIQDRILTPFSSAGSILDLHHFLELHNIQKGSSKLVPKFESSQKWEKVPGSLN